MRIAKRIALGTLRGSVPFLRDTFTDADSTLISAHVGEIGASWSAQATYTATPVPTISGNGVYYPAVSACQRASGVPNSANYYVETELNFKSVVGVLNPGPSGRMDATLNTMYFCRYHSGNLGWELYKIVNNAATQLGSLVPAAFPAGQIRRLRLTMMDKQISMQVDGATVLAVTDTSISAAGRAGFRVGGIANAPSTGIHINSIIGLAA